jgi:tryptophan halogenase
MRSKAIEQLVIVGGGSAGWLTAGLLAAANQTASGPGLRITLLESPDVAPVGVGEGTWPSMRDTLSRIGVSESDFFRACDTSFKQGSLFVGWADGGADDYYFHPFVLPQGYGETNLAASWQRGHNGVPFADLVSFQPHLCRHGKAPKQATTPEFAAVANYGYHLDAGKFGQFLRQHCIEKLGVIHVQDHVLAVNSRADGDIASLQTRQHGAIEADLFVDCSGSHSLLLGKHYGVPLLSQKHILFNDRAWAVQLAYPEPNSPIASQTTSTAQDSGWIWDIGLPTRRGIGHVYSSTHTSDQAAEQALLAYVERSSGGAQLLTTPRKLSFEPGYRACFWHRNCVAIGQSAGFIEPLEASALAMVELSATMLADRMPADRAVMDIVAKRFNDAFTYRWERVIDFLKLHYVLSKRDDSQYWRDNRAPASIPERLRESLALWRSQPPSRYDLHRIEEVFPSASYQYVMYGMGMLPEVDAGIRHMEHAALADGFFREAAALTRKMLPALPTNRELIGHIVRHGMPTR